ncbi:MAG: leucyl aminopeptidase family protein [Rhodospirillales bacterium]|nr:leucyl aminopeptidase family protein [Rhodospirillales bacterium]
MTQPLANPDRRAIPLTALAEADFSRWRARQNPGVRAWTEACGFAAKPGSLLLIQDGKGRLSRVVAGIEPIPAVWALAGLPSSLPKGTYRLDPTPGPEKAADWALGWALGGYAFDRYKEAKPAAARLVWPGGVDHDRLRAHQQAIRLVRDLVNTPAGDLGPGELAKVAQAIGHEFGAKVRRIEGAHLLKANYPAIHAVGRGSARPPALIDLVWGDPKAPKVTLVGKGVCFDSGGLDLKNSSAMKLMKKDMGGAAHALALARLVMARKLRVRLRVLIPAVENMPGANALRPLDVIRMRNGLTVEVGNTDAEGRLILADALAEASAERPELLIDFATLTGAARSALGPDLPALFTPDDRLAGRIENHAAKVADPVWRLPLWPGYRTMLDSKLADLNSAPDSPFAGAITAALFLERFVESGVSWAHFDLYAWNSESRPGRPSGGEAMTIRALFHMLESEYPPRRARKLGRGPLKPS